MILCFLLNFARLLLLLFFIILCMFCNPSFSSLNEPHFFLIGNNPHTPQNARGSKQNCSMNGSSEAKTTKISLRRSYNSCLKLPLNKSIKRGEEREIKVLVNGKYSCNPETKAYYGFTSMRRQPQIKNIVINTSRKDMEKKVVMPVSQSVKDYPQTLRMQKHYSNQISNLKKTRKSIQFCKQFALKPLKQSLVSIQSKGNSPQKLQQSLILVDFFHPSQLKLQQLSPFISTEVPQTPNIASLI